MNNVVKLLAGALLVSGVVQLAVADDEFYGIIESQPDNKQGTWVIGKRSVEVTEATELEEEHGPIKIGACVKVDIEGGTAEEIESESADKCSK